MKLLELENGEVLKIYEIEDILNRMDKLEKKVDEALGLVLKSLELITTELRQLKINTPIPYRNPDMQKVPYTYPAYPTYPNTEITYTSEAKQAVDSPAMQERIKMAMENALGVK